MSEPDDALSAFVRNWNDERYFEAHEVLEERWRRTGDPGERALIQCAAALHHLRRGNAAGTRKLLRAAAAPLRARASRDPSLGALCAWVETAIAALPAELATLLPSRPPLTHPAQPGSPPQGAEGEGHA